jgi:DNA adenine methylase
MMTNPVLKWAGGKRQIIEEVIHHFPRDFKDRPFHEPMVGGGAVTFRIEPKRGTINDINGRLMRFYDVVKNRPEELIERNRQHIWSEEYYYHARDIFNRPARGEPLDVVDEASLLVYLNRTCYNGLYRENSKGAFNVPFGRYKKVDYVQEKSILAASKILINLSIFNDDFEYILRTAKRGDLVYFDPPYQPVSKTSSFTSYHKDAFDFEEQVRLRDTIEQLDEKGVYVVLSNSESIEMRRIYSELQGFSIYVIEAKRAINCNGSKRGAIAELIVTNVPISRQSVRF